ncbi:MAG: tRNA lysidine(34) synthetase TilS [Candidatus Symbiobacter sp.]|nr:tRNA lysidine(34) synthetase TilS [Candidatus Symbiobacter sp.]
MTPGEFAALMQPFFPFEASPQLLAAVSGGADSLALTLLAAEWAQNLGGQIVAVTIDHQLRPESASEAAQVADWLQNYHISHHIIRLDGAQLRQQTGNLMQNARRLRYEKLQEFAEHQGILHILLGHHQQDQAETFLQNLARGSGLDGLSAMSPLLYRRNHRLLRPFLSIDKERLKATLIAKNQDWIEDPSNFSAKFQRVRIRQAVGARSQLNLSDARLALAAHWCQKSKIILDQAVADLMAQAVYFSSPNLAPGPHPDAVADTVADADPICAYLNGKIWAAAATETRTRLLAGLLQKIGGHWFRPRWQRLQHLDQRMIDFVAPRVGASAGQKFRANLAGCDIMALPMRPHKTPKDLSVRLVIFAISAMNFPQD